MSAIPASTDSTKPQVTVNFAMAHFCYRQLESWLASDDAKQLPEHQVEEVTRERGRELLRLLLQAHFHKRGTGNVGPALHCQSPAPASSPASVAVPPETGPAVIRLADKHCHSRT